MSEGPRNRRERRAATKADKKNMKPTDDIPLSHPDWDASHRPAKTLYDLAEERQALLAKGKPFVNAEGTSDTKNGDWEFMSDDPLGAFGEAIFYTASLSMLRFTLDVLVYNQYRQEIVWQEIWFRSLQAFPVLLLATYFLHTPTAKRLKIFRDLLFFVTSVAAGAFMVHSGNKYGYFAVMKRAPPIGTLWVWSVVEMNVGWAAGSLLVVVGYAWWKGYGFF
ncbi:hypothetical protein P152DRAFT_197136 [Eremomyces bilateralis CBS 781.70]|uniref:DUF7719 domain-containing protein n=1 Tax=Eremomyces bilateralis CBS 781.70 TaxID=1392243 RepID=A0A6G1GD31_9PEZI|nr:uncharacterized protein P152DRAFT_197136 [Eremomyces bilateralis CBS 781.70]KAF1815801.1 hypothetical protein P152DRAFT_197136 [Eremomyces bilateralis CBS 781.70]